MNVVIVLGPVLVIPFLVSDARHHELTLGWGEVWHDRLDGTTCLPFGNLGLGDGEIESPLDSRENAGSGDLHGCIVLEEVGKVNDQSADFRKEVGDENDDAADEIVEQDAENTKGYEFHAIYYTSEWGFVKGKKEFFSLPAFHFEHGIRDHLGGLGD